MENNTEQNEPHNMNLDDLLKTLEALNPKEKEVILPKDDLLNILLNLTRKKPEIPEGFMNAEQWAKKWNRHVSDVRRLLQKGVETGLLETKVFNVKTAHFNKVGRPSAHYRQKK
jgi:response regulator of citrate/malate metabolism